MQVQIGNRFFAKNEIQLRRKLETLNFPAFIKMEELDQENFPKLQFYHKFSELNNTKLTKENIEKALIKKAETKRDIERYEELREGLEKLGLEEMNYRKFRQFEKLSEGKMVNFQIFGELEGKEDLLELEGEKFSEDSNSLIEDFEKEEELEKRDKSIKEINDRLKETKKGIKSAKSQESKNYIILKKIEVDDKTINKDPPVIGSLRVYSENNRTEVYLDISPPETIKKHGFKEEIGWGSINESLISAILLEEGLIQKWKSEVKEPNLT